MTKREMVSRKLITIMTRLVRKVTTYGMSVKLMFNSLIYGLSFLQAEKEGISNDLHGDLSQNGGLVIVRKGGKVLQTFKQDITDEDKIAMKGEDILKALNIDASRLPRPVVQDAE